MRTLVKINRTVKPSVQICKRKSGNSMGNRHHTGKVDRGSSSTNVGTHRGMLTEVGPSLRTGALRMPLIPAQPYPNLPHHRRQASRPHSYLGHCIPLWAPRSQRCVRLEGSERRIRSKAAGIAGGREEVAKGASNRGTCGPHLGATCPFPSDPWVTCSGLGQQQGGTG